MNFGTLGMGFGGMGRGGAGPNLPLPFLGVLPDPSTLQSGWTGTLTGAASPVPMRFDGSNFYNISTGAQWTLPWWLPGGAGIMADFGNSRFYWNGAIKALSDLTDNGDGSYRLPWSATGLTWNGSWSVAVETVLDIDASPAGRLFGWHNSNTNRGYVEIYGATDTAVRWWLRGGSEPTATVGYQLGASQFDVNGADLTQGRGRHRGVWSHPSGGYMTTLDLTNQITTGTSLNGSPTAPVNLEFNRNAQSLAVATNAACASVVMWTRGLTADEVWNFSKCGVANPKHIIGDSFLTHGNLREAIMLLTEPLGIIGFSQDGVGSTTLAQQATRFESGGARLRWHDSDLIIMDGSRELDGPAAIAAIQRMVNLLNHNRWVYVQPNPINPIGDSRRTAWIADDGTIRAFCGEDHFCPTLEAAYAQSNGSAEDLAKVAQGLWPLSICADGTHPSDPPTWLAQTIYDWMSAKGWLP